MLVYFFVCLCSRDLGFDVRGSYVVYVGRALLFFYACSRGFDLAMWFGSEGSSTENQRGVVGNRSGVRH